MDRVPYRRVTPTRRRGVPLPATPGERSVSVAETVIVQLMICGALIGLTLLVNFVNAAPFASVKNGLRQALSGPATIQELTDEARQLGYEWLNIGAAPQTETLDLPVFEPIFETEIPPAAYETPPNPQYPGPLTSPGLRN